MLSSEKAPPLPMMRDYFTMKMEAEQYIINNCKFLKPVMIRPGVIVDKQHRLWSVPLGCALDITYIIGTPIVNYVPGGKFIDFLIPAKSTQLSSVAHFAFLGALGQVDEKIVTNEMML